MKIYGIYKGDMEGYMLQQPLYFKKEDAIKEALEIVIREQEAVVVMQKFTEDEMTVEGYTYNDWRLKEGSEDSWIGGYCDEYSVFVDEVDVV